MSRWSLIPLGGHAAARLSTRTKARARRQLFVLEAFDLASKGRKGAAGLAAPLLPSCSETLNNTLQDASKAFKSHSMSPTRHSESNRGERVWRTRF